MSDHMDIEERTKLLNLIRDLTDSGTCWFDHHGGCQEHGYLSLKPGEKCVRTRRLRSCWPNTV